MKKTYETPNVEKIAFQYRDQVVAASNPSSVCDVTRQVVSGTSTCSPDSNPGYNTEKY